MGNNLEEKILKRIKESGYPVEIKATDILKEKGWKVANQVGYLDEDEHKWRPIDIRAIRAEDVRHSPTYKRLLIHLYIECKRSPESPWVFYIREKAEMPFSPFDLVFLLKTASWPPVLPKSFLEIDQWKNCFHYLRHENVGVISFEPFRGEKSKVFEACYQVVKSAKYFLKTRDFPRLSRLKESIFSIIYPVIIFDGNLYGLYDQDGPLKPLNYLQYLIDYKEEEFLIDIVQLDFLREYIETVNEEFKLLKESINLLKPSIPNYR